MEAALVFVENCGYAGKTVGEVMAGIVTKCIAAARTKTKELALQVKQYKTTYISILYGTYITYTTYS